MGRLSLFGGLSRQDSAFCVAGLDQKYSKAKDADSCPATGLYSKKGRYAMNREPVGRDLSTIPNQATNILLFETDHFRFNVVAPAAAMVYRDHGESTGGSRRWLPMLMPM